MTCPGMGSRGRGLRGLIFLFACVAPRIQSGAWDDFSSKGVCVGGGGGRLSSTGKLTASF